MTLVEAIHDIGWHITNLSDELLKHLSKNDKELLLETTGIIKQQKEISRNVDKRKILLYVIVNLYSKVTNKVILLLKSLADIQKIIYLKEIYRTSQKILRLYNSCYTHFVLLQEIIGFNLVKVPREKLYGKYSHNLLEHAPLQFRIINGESINCKGEEKIFQYNKKYNKTHKFVSARLYNWKLHRSSLDRNSNPRYITS